MIAVRVLSGLPASCAVSKHKACLVLPVCCRSRSRAQSICMATHYAQQLLPAYTECDQNPIPRNYDELHSTDYPPDVDAVKKDFATKHTLTLNKQHLNAELDWWQVPEERRVLMMAMAMQESRHMDVEERDRVKDRQCPDNDLACNEFKDNATIFNLSKDLIQKTGFYNTEAGYYDRAGKWHVNGNAVKGQFQYLTNDQFWWLCTREGLRDAVGILSWAFDLWGIEDTLAFVRGGGAAFDPGNPPYCKNVPGQPSQWHKCCQATALSADEAQKVCHNVEFYLCCIKRMVAYIDAEPGRGGLMGDGRRPDIDCPYLA